MPIDILYHIKLFQLKAKATELIGPGLFEGAYGYKTFVETRFVWIERMNMEGDLLGRDSEMIKLQFLFKHLEEIKNSDRVAYKRACKLLRKSKKEDQYFGARMEIYVAASLARKGIRFKCRESPDYELLDEFSGVFIECGSAHIAGSSLDIVKKISLSVINKSKKPYANRNTLLMLDITNLFFRSLTSEKKFNKEEIRVAVSKAIETNGYGGVLLFCYGINEDATKISSNLIRVDSMHLSPVLLRLLENFYPMDGHVEMPRYFMSQS